MKARVKATGDIVYASYWNTSANGIKYYDIDNSGYTMTEDELDFDLSYTPDYWTRLEHQYAGMAMQGLMTILPNIGGLEGRTPKDEIVDIAMGTAHALVEKLKEKEERK
jgi:hypothetical protein